MQPCKYSFEAIGTQWEIATLKPINTPTQAAIHSLIEAYDVALSRFRSDSLVVQLSKQTGTVEFPKTTLSLLEFYDVLFDLTDGKVSPTVGSALEMLGYDASYSFVTHPRQAFEHPPVKLTRVGTKLRVSAPVTLDFGAAGKGFIVDRVAELLLDAGYKDMVVDASGDMVQRGSIENKVGLEHPLDDSKVIGSVDVENRALCASASNRRKWGERLHHIVDPDSHTPVEGIIATWVIADTAMVADGLATALFFVDPKRLAERYNYEYVRMHKDGSVEYSNKFEGKLY